MKIEINAQAKACQAQQAAYDRNACPVQQAGAVNTEGAAFSKSAEDTFIEELKQQGMQTDAGSASNKSRTEILEGLMTENDVAALKEYSDDFEDEELEVIVTVVEKIKTQLATYCDDYDSGMVDDLSPEQLEKLSSLTGDVMHVAHKLAQKNLPVTEKIISDAMSALDL